MGILTKDQILKAEDLKQENVSVPEWGGEVVIRTLTGTERDNFETSLSEGRGKNRQLNMANLRARLCALCIVDESGKRLFEDRDIIALGRKSAAALDRVFGKAQELNGFGTENIEELVKNSETDPNGGSTSD